MTALASVPLGGCSSGPEPRPLGADQFYRPSDRGGAIVPGARPTPEAGSYPTPEARLAAVEGRPQPGTEQPSSTENLDFVSKQVKPPANTAEAATMPTTQPLPVAKAPAEFAPGQFIAVGGIIAEVNGTPIYADDVLRAVTPLLANRAKDLDKASFRSLASTEINRQTDDLIRAEVAYASADRNTTSEEKTMANRVTEQWRDKLITENKGNIEEARKKIRESGKSFDEVLKEQYRLSLVRVYYARKLFPRIQVTADDMRRYYDKNKDTMFTLRDSATFRLIKISPKDMGSDAAAKAKVDELATRIKNGEDFATIAGEINHDPMLLRNKGLMQPIDRGAFKYEEVENAVWKINPGEVTPVIPSGGDYYIAKLENKRTGRVMAFEEDAVQKVMMEKLRGEQFGKMQRDLDTKLRKESVVEKKPQMLQTTVEMAMQNYARWRE